MVHQSVIHARLNQLGVAVSHWYKPELKELSLLLMDDEEIVALVTGRYYGGYAMMVATGQRLLLIDKKTMFMSLEDIRYDMISEIDYSSRLFDATITVFTVNKQHKFTSVKHKAQMRNLSVYAQKRIMEIRQPQNTQQLAREIEDSEEYDRELGANQPEHQNGVSGHRARHWTALTSNHNATHHSRSASVGTAAIRAAHLSAINPYANSSLMVKRNWSAFNKRTPPQIEPVSLP